MKIFLVVVILVVAALAVLISRRPDVFHVSRSLVMNASPDAVFEQVNDLHKMNAWSPWMKLDPDAAITYSGPDEGTGAAMAWDGDNKVGAGRMEITLSVKDDRVGYRLDFQRPMKSMATSTFLLVPQDGGTLVTWSMDGQNNFLAKAIGLVVDCEKMVGDQYDQGLQNLKAVVEAK